MSVAVGMPLYEVEAAGYAFRGGYVADGDAALADRLDALLDTLCEGAPVVKVLCWIAEEMDRDAVSALLAAKFGPHTAVVMLRGALPGGAPVGIEIVAGEGYGPGSFAATAALAIDRQTTSRLAAATDMKTEVGIVWNTLKERLSALGASAQQIVKATVYLDDIAEYDQFQSAYIQLPDAPAAPFVSEIGVTGGCRVQIEVLVIR